VRSKRGSTSKLRSSVGAKVARWFPWTAQHRTRNPDSMHLRRFGSSACLQAD